MVWSVLEARDGSLWVGSNDSGLNHIDRNGKVRVYTIADGLPDNTVYALWESGDGSIWTGSERGVLSRWQDGRITQYHDPEGKDSRLSSIVGAKDGSLWIGFHRPNGLAHFQNGQFLHYRVPGLVNTLAAAPDGALWVATDHAGVSRFQDGAITTYTTAQGLLSNFAQAVYIDRDGVAWVGTSPGGLNRIKNGKITRYSVDQGLFDLTVGAIVEDDEGNLWMTCNKGIFRVSKRELDDYADGRAASIHSVVYGIGDGLRSAEFNFGASPAAWKGSGGRLWFPTVAGVTSIDPAHSQLQSEEPKIAMEAVRVDGQEVMPEGGITAGPGTVDLEIQFTAPNFTAPERMQFRYRLRGFDPDWVNVGNRRAAYYTKLPPGQYVFMVQGANSDGIWSTDAATLEVIIKPRFWETWWFRLCCAAGLLLAGVGVFRLRVRYLVRRNHELEERVNQRTKELQEAIKAAEAAREALRELAMRDALTKLWNRHAILEILDHEASRAQREGTSLCILMADLDDFKQVNDTHGHLAGDCVLKEVALRFTALMRSYDSVGRYGGEELLIVLPGCSLQDGLHRAEEFRCAMVDESISIGAKTIFVSCSFGVSAAAEWATADRLIAEADEALYAAKHAGRNRVHSARECPA
jgi:diguanylate cyclase (GGDEF)-like protein